MEKYLPNYYAGIALLCVLTDNNIKSYIIKMLIFTSLYWGSVFFSRIVK